MAEGISLSARAHGSRKRPASLEVRVSQSGLHDQLGERADPWLGEPSAAERALSDSLRAEVRQLSDNRNLTDSRFKTALRLFEDAQRALPHRVWFLPLGVVDELRNAVHNEESFGMLAEFKVRQGSLQPGHVGEPVRLAQTYISLIKGDIAFFYFFGYFSWNLGTFLENFFARTNISSQV